MQGTAADLIKKAMIEVDQWLQESRSNAKMILQVHDELILEVPAEEIGEVTVKVEEIMCSVTTLSVPLVVDTGTGSNWKTAH